MANNENIEEMPLPIIAYGHRILRKPCEVVKKESQGINVLIENLWSTLELSGGVGLAAPQINFDSKIFIVNSKLMYDDLTESQRKDTFSGDKGIQETFINAEIIAESEEKRSELEGCLSIPGINEPVERSWNIIVEYFDKFLNPQRKQFSGYTAKVIQHEYDHINGILFIDHLPDLTKKILKGKLKKIQEGKVETDYLIQFLKYL